MSIILCWTGLETNGRDYKLIRKLISEGIIKWEEGLFPYKLTYNQIIFETSVREKECTFTSLLHWLHFSEPVAASTILQSVVRDTETKLTVDQKSTKRFTLDWSLTSFTTLKKMLTRKQTHSWNHISLQSTAEKRYVWFNKSEHDKSVASCAGVVSKAHF